MTVQPRPGTAYGRNPATILDDLMMQTVITSVQETVDTFSELVVAQKERHPAAAAHIQELTQHIAGITVDALRAWPRTDG